jgi:hypothetical protein
MNKKLKKQKKPKSYQSYIEGLGISQIGMIESIIWGIF